MIGGQLVTSQQLAIAPLLVSLVTAVGTLGLGWNRRLQVTGSLLGITGYMFAVIMLFSRVRQGGPIAYQLSGWPAPFGITLVADALSVLMLVLAAVISIGALLFTVIVLDEIQTQATYHPLFHFMLLGITGSFLTGDLFNLFVWFEVMLMASYILVVFFSGPEHTRATFIYVVLNLIGSAVMLLAIGGIYATVGTLNMADLAVRLASPGQYDVAVAPVLGLSAILFSIFGLKAGMVPFHFWVQPVYRAAPTPIAAMLAGVVKKVGIYAILRLYFMVFGALTIPAGLDFVGGQSVLSFYGPIILVGAVASILFGGLMAIDGDDIEELLAYSSIGQIGFILLPLSVAATVPSIRRLAIAASILYVLHHGVTKALLFLTSGAIDDAVGTTEFASLGGLSERTPGIAAAFSVGGLALIGVPPLFGFFGKLFVFETLVRAKTIPALTAALLGAILTITYITRAWNRGFWGEPSEIVGRPKSDRKQLVVIGGLALLVVLLGLGFDPVIDAVTAAADAALDREAYIEAVSPVLPGGGA